MSRFLITEPKESISKAKIKRPNWSKTRNPKRLEALSNAMSNAMKVSLVHGIRSFRSKILQPEKVYRAWITGDYAHITDTIPWKEFHSDLVTARDVLYGGFKKFADHGLDVIAKPDRPRLRYDYANPRITRVLDKRAGEWIVGIESDTRKSINEITRRQFTNALNPRRMAKEIRNYVGLYPRLANAHFNYVSGLYANGLSEEKIDRLSQIKYDQLLDYRANMIAKTETQFMLNRGQLEVWKEAKNTGLLPKSAMKVWVADGNPCPICDDMDGEAVPIDDVWDTDAGPVDIPTEVHPNCECIMTVEFGDDE